MNWLKLFELQHEMNYKQHDENKAQQYYKYND